MDGTKLHDFDPGVAAAEHLGNLRAAQLHETELDHVTLIGGKLRQQSVQPAASVGGLHQILERWPGSGHLLHLLQRRVMPFSPKVVGNDVVGDGEQPGAEGALTIAGQCVERLGEDETGGILCRFPTAEPLVAILVDGVRVVVVEWLERPPITLRRGDKRTLVRGLARPALLGWTASPRTPMVALPPAGTDYDVDPANP